MPHPVARPLLAALVAAMLVAGAPQTQAESFSGAYLAGMQADIRNDYTASALYYSRALLDDPANPVLLQSAMVAHVAAGNFPAAAAVARKMQATDPDNQIIGLVLLADTLAGGDFSAAAEVVAHEGYELNPLLADLAHGWIEIAMDNTGAGQDIFNRMNANDALTLYGQYNKALSLALSGEYAAAAALMSGGTDGPLHLSRAAIVAHVTMLSQAGNTEAALQVIEDALAGGFADRELQDMRDRLSDGETLPFTTVTRPEDGVADAYLVLASALTRENADRFALLYGRLATHIRPDFDEAKITVGEILARQQQFDLAAGAYAGVAPESPWFTSAEIGRANALNASERTDAAIEVLENLARANPDDISIQTALADTLRTSERFDEAAKVYERAVALVEEENPSHWVLYYSRGIAYERTDQWDKAEADFRHALDLQPDQPLVLNYLGYSLVELRRDLDEAQEMIEKAVAARPDDGYITDSLGWVLYRVGKYEEAVPYMERAVELLPVDPIINDHLGDVLWMVGRKREAQFQWRRALSFEPEEEDATRIRRKLEVGLDIVLEEEKGLNEEAATLHDG